VKYANAADDQANPAMQYVIGGAFLLLLFQLYRTMHGKGGSSSGIPGTPKKPGGGM